MASLQVLVNNLLVWQSSCESKLCPQYICPATSAACQCSAYNQNIDKLLAYKLPAAWMWYKLMLCFLCNGMATTCVYVHAYYLSIVA